MYLERIDSAAAAKNNDSTDSIQAKDLLTAIAAGEQNQEYKKFSYNFANYLFADEVEAHLLRSTLGHFLEQIFY